VRKKSILSHRNGYPSVFVSFLDKKIEIKHEIGQVAFSAALNSFSTKAADKAIGSTVQFSLGSYYYYHNLFDESGFVNKINRTFVLFFNAENILHKQRIKETGSFF
jgi:hypothetical protein